MSKRKHAGVDQATALQQYTLQGVQETEVELGRGSYAAVYAVLYKGLTCAAKNFYPALYQHEYSIRRFQEECALLSQVRHPNIVQFLGIYYQSGSMLPALVMEFLPMTLAQCLDQYGALPNEMGYSILKDVALALSYLHQHDPPIIHRDLTANNVLLTHGMTAKISDLGVAKILDLSLTQMRTMTNGPGTPCYMPPEALERYAHYNCKVDAFSYGVLMVHLFSGQWPFPKNAVKVDPQDDSRVIPQTEVDRRQENLDVIGKDHPLMTLTLRCLHNSPARRPEAVEILTQVSRVADQFPSFSKNKIEMLQQVTSLRADTERLQQEHQADIRSLKESSSAELDSTRQTLQAKIRSAQMQCRKAEKAVEESQRKLQDAGRCHSVEVKQLNLRLADTRDTLSSRIGELEAELRVAQQQISSKNSVLSDRDNEVAKLTGQMAKLRKEMDENEKVILQSQKAILSSKESLIASKDSIIHDLQEQLDNLRKSHTTQVSHRRELCSIYDCCLYWLLHSFLSMLQY